MSIKFINKRENRKVFKPEHIVNLNRDAVYENIDTSAARRYFAVMKQFQGIGTVYLIIYTDGKVGFFSDEQIRNMDCNLVETEHKLFLSLG